jgi:hypothetical protein
VQSPSTQHPFDAATQCPLVHTLFTHSLAAVQVPPLSFAQVFGDALESHFPETHTVVASVQIAVCRPSLGIGFPLTIFAVQVRVDRLQ